MTEVEAENVDARLYKLANDFLARRSWTNCRHNLCFRNVGTFFPRSTLSWAENVPCTMNSGKRRDVCSRGKLAFSNKYAVAELMSEHVSRRFGRVAFRRGFPKRLGRV